MVRSMVVKQARPPTKLETGSAMKTPLTAGSKRCGKRIVKGTTRITFLKIEKKMARFFLLRALKTVWPEYWKLWKIKAKK